MVRRRWYKSLYFWLALILLGTISGVGYWRFFTVNADKPTYLFGSVERGDIVMQVAATGTLAAVTTVQVGTQVSGTIAELHADFTFDVAFGKRGPCAGRPVIDSLRRAENAVVFLTAMFEEWFSSAGWREGGFWTT